MEGTLEEDVAFKLATRWAVTEGRAAICIGGRATGSAFFGWADDTVCRKKNNETTSAGYE